VATNGWFPVAAVVAFLVLTLVEMAIAEWLQAYRIDPKLKPDGRTDVSAGSFISRLQPSRYKLEYQRWVPLLWATFGVRILLLVAAIFASSGA